MLILNLQEEQDQDQLAQKIKIFQEIISRLPVKPLLQFRSVSKPWLSLISNDPSFSKLHFTHSIANRRTAFFISAYDAYTNERHFLTAPRDGGPLTHIITLQDAQNSVDAYNVPTETEHLNGLVFLTSKNSLLGDYDDEENFGFVVNPATRKVFKLPHLSNSIFFFGFDEPKYEHKILSIREENFDSLFSMEFNIFSLSTYSWRKIHVKKDEFIYPRFVDILCAIKHSVCVDSVIYLMDSIEIQIWAFDLTTEKFSIINVPQGSRPHESGTRFTRKGEDMFKWNDPFLMNVNGLLGVVCHDHVVETNEMHIWILHDRVNHVWVRETITFSESWVELDSMDRINYHFMEKIVFSLRRLSKDIISAFILDMTTKSFKLVNFTLGHDHQFLHSKTLRFHQVRSYVESLFPLREE